MAPLLRGSNVVRMGDWLVQQETRAQVVFSAVIGTGISAEVRFGIDRQGRKNAWRIVHIGEQQRMHADGQPWYGTPLQTQLAELTALQLARSPLLPTQTYFDQQNLFYMALRPYELDIIDLSVGLQLNLSDRLLTDADADRTFGEVAMTLAKAMMRPLVLLHEARWVHRDVKIDNVLWEPEEGPVLADYGFAAPLGRLGYAEGDFGSPMTMGLEVFGTAQQSARSYPTSDVFAAGMSLLRLMTLGRFDSLELFAGERAAKERGLGALARAKASPPLCHDEIDDEAADYVDFLHSLGCVHPWLTSTLVGNVLLSAPQDRLSAADLLHGLEVEQPNGGQGEQSGFMQLRGAFERVSPTLHKHSEPIFAALATISAPYFGATP